MSRCARSRADLNERGVPSAGGGAWSPQTLARMLGSARISGQREHKGEIVATAEWPAIISVEETRDDPGAAREPGAAHEPGGAPLPACTAC